MTAPMAAKPFTGPAPDLATEIVAYQSQLEAVHRMRNMDGMDPEAYGDAVEDLDKAESAMTAAWLERLAA